MDKLKKILNFFINDLNDTKLAVAFFNLERTKKLIIELNTKKQLFKEGIDSKNFPLPNYSVATEILTRGRKKAGTPFNLFDTGEFYNSFRVTVLNNGDAEITAETLKESTIDNTFTDLEVIASRFILGLTDDSLEILKRVFIEEIQKKIREYIRGA